MRPRQGERSTGPGQRGWWDVTWARPDGDPPPPEQALQRPGDGQRPQQTPGSGSPDRKPPFPTFRGPPGIAAGPTNRCAWRCLRDPLAIPGGGGCPARTAQPRGASGKDPRSASPTALPPTSPTPPGVRGPRKKGLRERPGQPVPPSGHRAGTRSTAATGWTTAQAPAEARRDGVGSWAPPSTSLRVARPGRHFGM